MNRKHQNGFTLIELIIVIVIIGILAAIALPKYIDAQRDARVAKTNAIYGNVRTAMNLAKARCELDLAAAGTCTNAAGTVTMDGVVVTMVNRYPTGATSAGIQSAAGYGTTAVTAAQDGITVAFAGTTTTITPNGATTPATCNVTYTSATAVGVTPVTGIATAGC